MADMTIDIFAQQPYGKIALEKMGNVPENFRLFAAGWIDDDRTIMKVEGAEFRRAKSGPNKGKLSIMVRGTIKKAYVSVMETMSMES